MLLVTSTREDDHVQRLLTVLDAQGADALVVDPSRFPVGMNLSVECQGETTRTLVGLDGRELDLARVSAVWWQRPRSAQASPRIAPEQREWASRQAQALLDGIWDSLDALWVPGPRRRAEAADSKVRQLAVAQRVGFKVPRTLVSHEPARVLAFYDACEGRVISKVLRDGRVTRDGEKHLAYTHVVKRRDLHDLASVTCAPVVFQEQIPKRLELRVTVVGERVFSAAIDSQQSPFAREDFRRADHLVACTAHRLDREIEEKCVRLLQALELTFGAIDLILTPTGEHVFLEINANGQWAWVESRAKLPIAGALAELMLSAPARTSHKERDDERV